MRTKLTIAAALTAFSLGTAAFAQSDWLSRQMYTLNPSLQLYGPRQGSMAEDEYRSRIFRLILEEAQRKAEDYARDDAQAYTAFIVGALTIPLHEGSNTHFRIRDNDGRTCQERSNSGRIVRHTSSYASVFSRIFKNANPQPVPDCSELNDDAQMHQLLHGADGSDLGIMQVNMRWHERNFLATGDWTSVRKSIRYGLSLFAQGFDGVYRNSSRYTCILTNGRINYTNLIRGAWAGVYNSGNLSSSCRFANTNSDWAANDRKFYHNLSEVILKLDTASKRREHYPLRSTEDALLGQIISGFKNKTATATLIQNYLASASLGGLDQQNPLLREGGFVITQPPRQEPTRPTPTPVVVPQTRVPFENQRIYQVTASVLNYRDAPSTTANDCGDLPERTEVIGVAKVGGWIELQNDEVLSSYEEYGHRCGELRYAHEDYLRDLGPLNDRPIEDPVVEPVPTPVDEPVEEPIEEPVQEPIEEPTPVVVPVPVVTPAPTPAPVVTPAPSNRKIGRVTDWINVREDRPRGYTMAPPTGDTVGPAGAEVIIEETVWNSSNSRYPWYRIVSPVRGWIYGQFVEIEGE